MSNLKLILIVLMLAGLCSSQNTINGPSQLSYDTSSPACTVGANAFDGNVSSKCEQSKTAGATVSVTGAMNGTFNVSRIDWYMPSGSYGFCQITEAYVSTSDTSWGSNVIDAANCLSSTTGSAWHNCSLNGWYTGNYFKIVGKSMNSPPTTCDNSGVSSTIGELRLYGLSPPPPPTPPASGPCRAYCDRQMIEYVPMPPDGNYNVSHIWNVSLTGTYSNPEGQAYVNDTFSNILITTTNGTRTGSCPNHTPGIIYWVGRIGASGRNVLVVNYSLGNSSDDSCTLTAPTLSLCFNGTAQNAYAYALRTEQGNFSSTFDVVNDSYAFYHYNVTFYNDASGGLYNFTLQTATSTFYCGGQYEAFPITIVPSATSYIVQTRTKANIVTTLTSGPSRTYQTDGGAFVSQYLPNNSGAVNQYVFTLNDYTGGQWLRSNMLVLGVVNNTQFILDNASFSQDNLIYGYYANSSRIKLLVKNQQGKTIDLGYIIVESSNLNRNVIISQPVLSEPIAMFNDLIVTWTQDFASSQVGATVTSVDSAVFSNFTVSNVTDASVALSYAASASGSATYSYTLPNPAQTVQLDLTLVSVKYGTQHWSKMVTLRNETVPLNSSAFTQPLGDTIMGTATATVKKLIVALLIIFSFYVFCKATDYGTGLLVTVGEFGFFWYVGWVPQTQVPFWFIAMLAFIAFMVKMFERRSM